MDAFGVAFVPVLLAYAAVPAAIAVAVLRYRLYEIDRIISRTLSWATVSGVLVVVFAGLVVGLQALLTGVTQGQTLAVAASTLVAFALFQPVRRRVQRAVDRRFDRARYDSERTAAAFAERLRTEVDLDAVARDLDRLGRARAAPDAASDSGSRHPTDDASCAAMSIVRRIGPGRRRSCLRRARDRST